MTTTDPKPDDWDSLVCQLVELRDALLLTELALRDYQFTLDSSERRAAQCHAAQCIEIVRGCKKGSEKVQSRHQPLE